MKWRENNKDKYLEYKRAKSKEYYDRDKEDLCAKKREKYQYERYLHNCNTRIEFELLRNIEVENLS